jgi:hypothetical protein
MPLTIPGTPDDYVACEYDELCSEARQCIDAVVNSNSVGTRIGDDVAMAILRFLGVQSDEAGDLLEDARIEAQKH